MFFTVKELSKYFQIKPSTLYSWASKGVIPHYKVHGLLRFKKEEIDRWVDSFRKEPLVMPHITSGDRGNSDIDTLIARAKREVYNLPRRGNQTVISPKKGG